MEDIHAEGGSESVTGKERIGSVKLNAMGGDKQDTVSETQSQIQFMCGDKDGLVLPMRQFVEQFEYAEPVRKVKMSSGFVKQNKRSLLCQGFGNEHPLTLSVAQSIEHLAGISGHTYRLQSLYDTTLVLLRQSAEKRSVGVPPHSHNVMDGCILQSQSLGEHQRHSPCTLRACKGRERGGAAQLRLQAGKRAQQR